MTRAVLLPRHTAEITAGLARVALGGSPSLAVAGPSRIVVASSSRSATPSSSGTTCFARRAFSTSQPRSLATEAPAAEAEPPLVSENEVPTAEPAPQWSAQSRRVGLLARKRGMVTYFLSTGQAIPCTVLQVDDCQISAQIGFPPAVPHPTHDETGSPLKVPKLAPYTALQVAATEILSNKGIKQSQRGHLKKAGISKAKRVMKEFKITRDAVLPLGTTLSAAHFVPGQDVDVAATSRGKGFQGGMKRHGFKGQRASHGNSVSHRALGSTGQHQDPGRVFPGKKMPGRMGGNHQSTVHGLKVLRIDLGRELILVKGNVPGPDGGMVQVTDARRSLIWKAAKKNKKQGLDGQEALPEGIEGLPFPAGTRAMKKGLPQIVEWTGATMAPAS